MANSPLKVFLTGGSGFVGAVVIAELLARGHSINALLNHGKIRDDSSIRIVRGDLFNAAALDDGLRDADAAIHLVGIILESPRKGITFQHIHVDGTRAVVEAVQRSRVKRYVQMSALGTRPDAVAEYHKTKFAAEQIVRASGLDWTIIRPSLIHGPGGFMEMEAKWARKQSTPFLFMPSFGGGIVGQRGAGLLQPVYVNDVARAFVDSIENEKLITQTIEIGGPERMTWPQMHHIASKAIVGHQRMTLALPVWLGRIQAATLPTFLAPFNQDQITMSQEDNVCDLAQFEKSFGWKPDGFAQSLSRYVDKL